MMQKPIGQGHSCRHNQWGIDPKQWRDKGAVFLTEPLDNHGLEWRCYTRDPDGDLIEVGQYTQLALDHFKKYAG